MTQIINIYEAKTQLSKLVERAASGEDIVIARAGKPIVRLVPVERAEPRKPGILKELNITVPDSFFEPLPEEELEAWE